GARCSRASRYSRYTQSPRRTRRSATANRWSRSVSYACRVRASRRGSSHTSTCPESRGGASGSRPGAYTTPSGRSAGSPWTRSTRTFGFWGSGVDIWTSSGAARGEVPGVQYDGRAARVQGAQGKVAPKKATAGLTRGARMLIFNRVVKHAPERLDRVFFALSDPTRRAILARVADAEGTVTAIAAPFSMSLAAVSKHIRVLQRAR